MSICKESWYLKVADMERERSRLLEMARRGEISAEDFMRRMLRLHTGPYHDRPFYLLEEKRRGGKTEEVFVSQPWLDAHGDWLEGLEDKYRRVIEILVQLDDDYPEVREVGGPLSEHLRYLTRLDQLSNLGTRPEARTSLGYKAPPPKSEKEFNDYVREKVQEVDQFISKWDELASKTRAQRRRERELDDS